MIQRVKIPDMKQSIRIKLNPYNFIPRGIKGVEDFGYADVYPPTFIEEVVAKHFPEGSDAFDIHRDNIIEYFQEAARILAGQQYFVKIHKPIDDIRRELRALKKDIGFFHELSHASFDCLVRCAGGKVMPYSFFDTWLAQGKGLARESMLEYYIGLPNFRQFIQDSYSTITLCRLIDIVLPHIAHSHIAPENRCLDAWAYFLAAVHRTFLQKRLPDNPSHSQIKIGSKIIDGVTYIPGISDFFFDCYAQACEGLKLTLDKKKASRITKAIRTRIDHQKEFQQAGFILEEFKLSAPSNGKLIF